MDIHDLAKCIADDIHEAGRIKPRGAIVYAVKKNSDNIRAVLSESHLRIPDLFREITKKMDGPLCHPRTFRRMCDKHVDWNRESRTKTASHQPQSLSREGSSSEDQRLEVAQAESYAHELGDEWDEILSSLGPAKQIQLPKAVKNGLTLQEALDAKAEGVNSLRELLTTFIIRKKGIK